MCHLHLNPVTHTPCHFKGKSPVCMYIYVYVYMHTQPIYEHTGKTFMKPIHTENNNIFHYNKVPPSTILSKIVLPN